VEMESQLPASRFARVMLLPKGLDKRKVTIISDK